MGCFYILELYMISSNYRNLFGIFQDRNQGVASQRGSSGHKGNDYSGQNSPLGKGIFLHILKSYGNEKMQ